MSTNTYPNCAHNMESKSSTKTASSVNPLRYAYTPSLSDDHTKTRQHTWWKSDNYKTSVTFDFYDKVASKEEAYAGLISYYGRENIVAAKALTNKVTKEQGLVIEIVLTSQHLRDEASTSGMDIFIRNGSKCRFRGTRTLQPDAKFTVLEIYNLPLEDPAVALTKVRKAIELSYAAKAENVLDLYAQREPVGDIYEGRVSVLLEGNQPVPGREVYIFAYKKFYPVSFSFL